MVPPAQPGYLDIVGQGEIPWAWEYNPAKANQILDESGFAERDAEGMRMWKGERLELRFYIRKDDPIRKMIGDVLVEELTKVGIRVDARYVDYQTAIQEVFEKKDFHLYTSMWGNLPLEIRPTHLEFWTWSNYWHPKSAPNCGGYNDSEFNTAVSKMMNAASQEEAISCAHLAQYRQALMVLGVPLYCIYSIYPPLSNKIYHNNLVKNTVQAYASYGSQMNFWDDEYPNGGNYWSDYTGIDICRGPFQNETGSDGLGDTAYVIDENNVDRYPLMGSWTIEGSNVSVIPSIELTIAFENVTSAGITTVNITDVGPNPPLGFKLAGNYYDIKTTANYSGTVRLRIVYDDSNMTIEDEMSLRLMQWDEALQEWVDITTGVDIENNVVFGETTHLSIFAIFTTVLAPPPLSVSISPLSASIIVGQSITFTSTVSGGYPPYNYQWYLNDSIVSGAASNNWTFTPLTIGTYKVYLKVTDSSGNVAISDTATITVAPQLTISISPMSASILVGQSVTFTSTTSGGYPPYTYQWFLNGNPVSGATSNTWTFTPTTSGIFYVYLKVTDAKGNTAQSDAARIVASTVPVGGYSIPIQLPTTVKPVTIHIALLTIITAVLITIKQKTRRKHRQ